MMDNHGSFDTPIIRYYIDTRPYVPERIADLELPLLETLPQDIQDAVGRYLRAQDRLMSLASALLKYLFIHREAKIPWSDIRISRTPKPHGRPYWDPPSDWQGEGFEGLEFNVSHQAGMVILAGSHTPQRPKHMAASQSNNVQGDTVNPEPDAQTIRIGVDVACTQEPRRTPDLSTQSKLNEWVDTFAEMFSEQERTNMKHDPIGIGGAVNLDPTGGDWQARIMEQKARRFYTCWALKEAYIKMVGEGLLANWLQELEFLNVLPPGRGDKFGTDETGMQVLFRGRDITDAVDVELEGLGDHFILATICSGIRDEVGDNKAWKTLDIERDIAPCAEGTCHCLG